HLLNLFQGPTNASASSGTNLGPQLNRIFDYIETPSPFVRTEQWYTLADFTTASTGSPSPPDNIANSFRPPFMRLSRQRDPGRININTIFDVNTFRAAIGGVTQSTAD